MPPSKFFVTATTLLTLALAGCRATTPAPDVRPDDPDRLLEHHLEVHWVRNSAEYRALFLQTYRLAGERLEERVAGRSPGTWAVALDADETVVDNSQYQVELAERGASYTSESFDAWVRRQESPPLPGVLDFLAKIQGLGGKIAIVTNRNEPTCDATEANFRKYSIPFDVILCQTDERAKEPRWKKIEHGEASPDLPPLEIVMWIGDNIHDFPDHGQEMRFDDETAFSTFGVEHFVVPNPMYGSWQGNPER